MSTLPHSVGVVGPHKRGGYSLLLTPAMIAMIGGTVHPHPDLASGQALATAIGARGPGKVGRLPGFAVHWQCCDGIDVGSLVLGLTEEGRPVVWVAWHRVKRFQIEPAPGRRGVVRFTCRSCHRSTVLGSRRALTLLDERVRAVDVGLPAQVVRSLGQIDDTPEWLT